MHFDQKTHPHRRRNPLTGQWILVSPQRSRRPWRGHTESQPSTKSILYDKDCYLCPENTRSNNQKNPRYTNTFVFQNDFQALLPEHHEFKDTKDSLFMIQQAEGQCKVVCFSPHHTLTLAEMSESQILEVLNTWIFQLQELTPSYRWVQIFENKGGIMGASNPHPHSQLWASDFLPSLIALEDKNQNTYFQENTSVLLLDYGHKEIKIGQRIVVENKDWLVVVPFWAVWPFETMVLPRFHIRRMQELDDKKRKNLSQILKILLVKYDNLFKAPFPYSMGIHQAPLDSHLYPHWQFHIHFNPPLLRSATVQKFMVGYEMFAENQRDLTAEAAAERLRQLSDIHYKKKG